MARTRAERRKAATASELHRKAQQQMPSGVYLPIRARATALRTLVVALDHDVEELAALSVQLSWLQMDLPVFKPILLLNTPDVAPIRRRRFVYETAIDRQTWPRFDDGSVTYADYLDRRVVEMASVYDPHRTIEAHPFQKLPRWAFST